jgi:hypothetical protein
MLMIGYSPIRYPLSAIRYSLCAFATLCLCAFVPLPLFPYPENIHHLRITSHERRIRDVTVYLLIRKRAVLRYIWRLLVVCVSLLANICVL